MTSNYPDGPQPFPAATLGIMTHVAGDCPTETVYADTISLARKAEQSGFGEFWIAQHHFMPKAGHVPSPFIFLAHLGAHVPTLTLGVAVVALPFENPIRLAEDIATTQKLLGPRLNIGIGPGNPASDFGAFGITAQERHTVFGDRYAKLLELLHPASDAASCGPAIWPPPDASSVQSLYQATYTPATARRIGERDDGLLLSVTHPRAGQPGCPMTAGDGQREIIEAYLDALAPGRLPRVTATRAVHITDDPTERDEVALHALKTLSKVMGHQDTGATLDALGVHHPLEAVEILGYSIGPVEHVQERLRDDPSVAVATGIIFQGIVATDESWLRDVTSVAGLETPVPVA